jgi:hypothetical protein
MLRVFLILLIVGVDFVVGAVEEHVLPRVALVVFGCWRGVGLLLLLLLFDLLLRWLLRFGLVGG